jgi:hypothetical protein
MRRTLLAVAALDLAPVLRLWAVAREMAQLIAVTAGHSGRVPRLHQINFKTAIGREMRTYLSALLAAVSGLRAVAACSALVSDGLQIRH